MIASQTVYLNADKSQAVAEGDKSAAFLLVRAGHEVHEKEAAKYPGAIELIGGTKKSPKGADIETREPEIENRDPSHKKHGR